jgi:hypothetical protein
MAIEPGMPTIGEAFRFAWATTKQNLGLLAGATLLFILPDIGQEVALEAVDDGSPFLTIAINLLRMSIGAFFSVGFYRILLALTDGRETSFGVMNSGRDKYLSYFGASLLFTLLYFIGAVAFILPVLYVVARFGLVFLCVVDRDASPVSALDHSSQLTKGIRWKVLWFVIVADLVSLSGFLALGVRILISFTIGMLMVAYAYRKLERHAAQAHLEAGEIKPTSLEIHTT